MAPTSLIREFEIQGAARDLARRNSLSARTLATQVKISESQARKYIAQLRKFGVLQKVGSAGDGAPGRNAIVWGFVPRLGTQRTSSTIKVCVSHEQWDSLLKYQGDTMEDWQAPRVYHAVPSLVTTEGVFIDILVEYDASIMDIKTEFLELMNWDRDVLR